MCAPSYRLWLSTKSDRSRHSENRPAPNPLRSTRFSQSDGMIWSVSTSDRSSGTARAMISRTASIGILSSVEVLSVQVRRRGEVAGDGGGRRDRGGHGVGSATFALAAFEVAVAGARGAFARRQLVGVHGQAHRAAGLTPLESRRREDRV